MTVATIKTVAKNAPSELQKLLEDKHFLAIPKIGDVVRGRVVSTTKNEVHIDLGGYSGVVRGRELYNESAEYGNLKVGDEAEATVVGLDNELGEAELSFRFAGQQKSWEKLEGLRGTGITVNVVVKEANKGGLIVDLDHNEGFLPVSQLSAEHYPRVPGGDKARIQEKLKSFIGETLRVKVLDVDGGEGKLIVSEKKIEEDSQITKIAEHQIGENCEGPITAIADFGAFMEFADGLTGLIHISELAWQRVEHPSEVVKEGQQVKAQIININGPKVFLSMKRLLPDPWKTVEEKYKVGQQVKGKIKKVNSFGLFVELDEDIQGLAHISELGMKQEEIISKIKPGDELEFTIVSLKPEEYRLGLSLVRDTVATNTTKTADETTTENKQTEATLEDKTTEAQN